MKITLAAARVNRKLTQKEVAQKLGLTTQTIYNIENHRTSTDIKTLLKLCELYDVRIEDLKLEEGE